MWEFVVGQGWRLSELLESGRIVIVWWNLDRQILWWMLQTPTISSACALICMCTHRFITLQRIHTVANDRLQPYVDHSALPFASTTVITASAIAILLAFFLYHLNVGPSRSSARLATSPATLDAPTTAKAPFIYIPAIISISARRSTSVIVGFGRVF